MSLLKFICASTIVGAALTLSAHSHAQTTDPMRTACANFEYARVNEGVCEALAKMPVDHPVPSAYMVTPESKTPLPFYGTYDQCVKVIQARIDKLDFLSKPSSSDARDFCIPAK